tara:strand:+ start:39105 stop:39446 length:342 start_codon:yes stop_codon:yes gene_type:complete
MTDFKIDNKEHIPENSFILYSTSACHLCNDAIAILNDLHEQMLDLAEQQGFSLSRQSVYTIDVVDVVEDSSLMEVYGPRIPVLIFPSSSEELAWPFDIQSAYQFILPKLSFPS